jgi:hypothetical protein
MHPLDLAEARQPFRTAWLIGAVTSLPVATLVAVIIWFAAHSYVVPLMAGAVIFGFGQLASAAFKDRAWGFIPPESQDRQRPLPATWELGSGLALGLVLAIALLLLTFRLDQADVPVVVREFTFGMSACAGLLVLGDFVARVIRGQRERRYLLFSLPAVVAVLGVLVVAPIILFDSSLPGSFTTVGWGVAAMLLAGAVVAAWKLLQDRGSGGRHPGLSQNQ